MSMEIEVPVGGIIKVHGSEMVCVEDFKDGNDVYIGCCACPLTPKSKVCRYFNCGFMRGDGKSVHFEYYYR